MNYGFTLKQCLNYGCVWNAVTIAQSAVWLSSEFHKVIITIVLWVIDIQADNDFQSTNDVHFRQHKEKYINYLLSYSIYIRPSTLPLPLSQGGTHCRWIWHRWFLGVRWRVSFHWLCVHSVTWCWSAEITRLRWDPDPNPLTSHARCLRLAWWSGQIP